MDNEWNKVLDNLKVLSNTIKSSIEPIADIQDKLSQSIRPLIATQAQIVNSFKPIIEAQENVSNKLNSTSRSLKEAFQEIALLFVVSGIFSKLSELAKEGWYIGVDFFDIIGGLDDTIINETESDNIEINFSELKLRIKQYFPDYVNNIHRKVNKISVERRPVFNEIFALYNEERYLSLIPLVLIQIDGLCKQHFGMGFFSTEYPNKKNGNKSNQRILSVLEENDEIEDLSIALLLYSQVDFDNRNELVIIKKDMKDLSLFNRHSILHGESVEYGTSENAVKALLLLDFVCDLVNSFKEK